MNGSSEVDEEQGIETWKIKLENLSKANENLSLQNAILKNPIGTAFSEAIITGIGRSFAGCVLVFLLAISTLWHEGLLTPFMTWFEFQPSDGKVLGEHCYTAVVVMFLVMFPKFAKIWLPTVGKLRPTTLKVLGLVFSLVVGYLLYSPTNTRYLTLLAGAWVWLIGWLLQCLFFSAGVQAEFSGCFSSVYRLFQCALSTQLRSPRIKKK